MEFPPRAFYPRRFQASPAQYTAEESAAAVSAPDLRDKLATLVDRTKKVKMAYHQLQSQIAFGLVEAGEVFDSLAIPLMKLVGLKTSEMESEGRHSAFIFNTERYHHMDTARSGDLNIQIRSSKEENYAAKAETAGKEILHKHKGQLRQLVHMLKHIETQVNSHREDILQMVDDRRTFFQEFIQKSLYYLSSVHSQNHDTFPVTVKLLRVLFNNINEVLGSVDTGVNDLMQALAKNMCHPMTKYVGNLAAEIKHGPCVQLMNVVNEMERSNSDTRRELQDARERIRLAEETKINALSKLKKAEDQVQRMTTSAKFLLPASQKKQAEHSITGKRIGTEGSREHEEKLLWELLSKRRKQQEPESPMGPKELIRQSDTKQKTLVYNRRRTRSQALLSSQTARPDALIPLGLSPSARTVTWRPKSSSDVG
ncbi:hypothetical protein ISN45_At05g057980 [Arabidopsis thaliana x Arabidopsis arenosa]|uniref:Uncharacterized protein n=3 Tax=Arabidopsis TaxID=3701 RepID=A0A8T2DU90_ARASU|nr:hypothetical protein ISN45_At05g057980 [Arabidopsis thaliana x Arabidopsis arenosa]KAG7613850.1 hypothetical protein ISN44_As05g057210 [Arabidopsis suecica]